MKFNSQICTSREQSECLLAMGLKKETADMYYRTNWINAVAVNDVIDLYEDDVIPAWSLGRLIKDLMPQSIGHLELAVGSDYAGYYEDRCESETGIYWEHTEESSNLYDNIISTIEWLIKEGYFNKEYLV